MFLGVGWVTRIYGKPGGGRLDLIATREGVAGTKRSRSEVDSKEKKAERQERARLGAKGE